MNVDSLVISLGLDPTALKAALGQVDAAFSQFMQKVQGFADGVQQGLNGATNGAAQASNAAQGAAGRMQAFGQRAVSTVAGLAMRFAGPLTALASAGGIFNKYMGDVAQVAQMTGRYSTQMEEWRKKRELLSRINRDDIELYRKGKLGLLDFNFAMAGLATTIMRAISPAIRFGIELLGKVSNWIRENEPNIVRFLGVVAGIITAVMVPALWKMAAAMLANPITWIVAGLVALALVIDDLIVYMNGGESALSDFWAIFGTGEEIAQSLGAAWEWLKTTGKQLWEDVKAAAAKAWAMFEEPIEHVKAAFQSFVSFVKNLMAGNWREAGEDLRNVFINIISAIGKLFGNLAKALFDAIVNVGGQIKDWLVENVFNVKALLKGLRNAGNFIGGLFGFGGDKEEQPEEQPQQALPAGGVAALPTNEQLTATATASGSKPATTINNDSKTNIGAINIQSQATDADGIMRDARGAADRQFANLGTSAADGSIRQ